MIKMQIDHNTAVAASAARPGAGRRLQNGPAPRGTRARPRHAAGLAEGARHGGWGERHFWFCLLLLCNRAALGCCRMTCCSATIISPHDSCERFAVQNR